MEFEFFTDYFFACTFNAKSRFSLYAINDFKLLNNDCLSTALNVDKIKIIERWRGSN